MPAERALAELVATKPPTAWAGRAIELALAAIGDTFAIGLAGMRAEQTGFALATVRPSTIGHKDAGVSPLWSGSDRYPVADAAFVTGVACHSLDWDDYTHPMHGHASAVLLPVAWTLVEARGGSGQDLLDAYLVGYQADFLASLVLAHSHYRRGWHATSTVGVIGAAAAAAHVLGQDADTAEAALAIGASFASGLQANFGTSTKALHAGAAARHGIQAAQLAAAGARGNASWLFGTHGMLATFGGDLDDITGPEAIAAQVASGEHGIETAWGLVQKAYPCCGSCHASVDALIALVTELDLAPEDIELIEVHVDPLVPRIMREVVPTDPYTARYSISWVMAAAAADRDLTPEQLSREALTREDLHRLRERVRIVTDLDTTDDDRYAGRIVILHRDGTAERTVRHTAGHSLNPMSPERARAKQRHALASVIRPASVDVLLDAVAGLAAVADLRDLGDLVRSSVAHD